MIFSDCFLVFVLFEGLFLANPVASDAVCRKYAYKLGNTVYYDNVLCTHGCCRDVHVDPCCGPAEKPDNTTAIVIGSTIGGVMGLIFICATITWIISKCVKGSSGHPTAQTANVFMVYEGEP